MTNNLYAKRDHQALGDHYLRHIDRMTVEGLHAKSAIAGELAWRDARIAELGKHRADVLRQRIAELEARIDELEDDSIKEAHKKAELQLRVLQLTQRLDMCNRMKSAAEHEIAAAKGGT